MSEIKKSVQILYGPAGSGKTTYCMQAMKKIVAEGGKTLLIVPEQFSHQSELNMIHHVGVPGLCGADVLSFRRMAARVIKKTGGIAEIPMSDIGKGILLGRAIDRVKGQLHAYKRSVEQRGFIDKLDGIISELKRYQIAPEQLQNAIEQMQDTEALKNKVRDIARIYTEFEGMLQNQYMDENDELSILLKRLLEYDGYRDCHIFIDGFHGFTPQELAVIEGLLEKTKSVHITLCMDFVDHQQNEIFAPIFATYEQIDSKVPPILVGERAYRFDHCRELGFLERNYGTYERVSYGAENKDITLFAANTPYEEVEYVAREVIKQMRDHGRRLKEMMVISRNLEAYEKLIKVVFSQYGIAYFIDSKTDISTHPIAMLLTSSLELAYGNWTYETVMRYLRTGLTGIPMEEIDSLENYILKHGKKGKAWRLENIWEENNEIKEAVVLPIEQLRMNLKQAENAQKMCESIYNFFCALEVPTKAKTEQNANVFNSIVDILEQIAQVCQDDLLSRGQLTRAIAMGIANAQIATVPPALDQIMVGSVERSRSHAIQELYIIGVNDGIFPNTMADDGILTDADRSILNQMGIGLAPDTRKKTFEEQYLIYSTLTTPSKGLHLSYAAADHEGKIMRPSSIITRLKAIFPKLETQYAEDLYNEDRRTLSNMTAPLPVLNQLIDHMRLWTMEESPTELWTGVYHWYKNSPAYENQIKQITHAFDYKNTQLDLSKDSIEKLYGHQVYTSVSKLEQYARCPFSYFIQHGIKAKERKRFQVEATDIGSFLHEAIEQYSKLMAEEGKSWRQIDPVWSQESILRIVQDCLTRNTATVFNSSARYLYMTKRLESMLQNTIDIIAYQVQGGDFEPFAFELEFGTGKDIDPLTLRLEDGKEVIFVGKIDRVDHLKLDGTNFYRVIDYKSGNKTLALDDIYEGLSLQLISYMEAVLQGYKGKNQMGAMLYFIIDEPMVDGQAYTDREQVGTAIKKEMKMRGLVLANKEMIFKMDDKLPGTSDIVPVMIKKDGELGSASHVISPEQYTWIRHRAVEKLRESAQSFLKGNIEIRPYKKDKKTGCDYCKYDSICQFDLSMEENKYRKMISQKDQEIWEKLRKEAEANE